MYTQYDLLEHCTINASSPTTRTPTQQQCSQGAFATPVKTLSSSSEISATRGLDSQLGTNVFVVVSNSQK